MIWATTEKLHIGLKFLQVNEGGDIGWDGWMASLLNGHEFEQTLRASEGQGNLVCCSPWVRRVGHDLETEQQQQNLQDYSS